MWNIFKDKTKPHAFSWLIWGIMATYCFCIASVPNNRNSITREIYERTILFLRLFSSFSIVQLTNNGGSGAWAAGVSALVSVVLITIIDALGFFPTARKSFNKPFEETTLNYFLSGLKWVMALFALGRYSIVNWLYPVSLIITNWSLVAMLFIRRKKIGKELMKLP